MIEFKLAYNNVVNEKLKNISDNTLNEIDSAIKNAAFLLQRTVKKKISQGSRKGKIYRLYRGGKKPILHRASSPGEPPKTDTGRLVNSIGINFSTLKAEAGSDVNYSEFLEGGTRHMLPRSFLNSSLTENENTIERYLYLAIKKAISS